MKTLSCVLLTLCASVPAFAQMPAPGLKDTVTPAASVKFEKPMGPDMEVGLAWGDMKTGPFGAKGVGESATFGLSPAVANAIQDAVGVRLTELPMNPEAVFKKMQDQ